MDSSVTEAAEVSLTSPNLPTHLLHCIPAAILIRCLVTWFLGPLPMHPPDSVQGGRRHHPSSTSCWLQAAVQWCCLGRAGALQQHCLHSARLPEYVALSTRHCCAPSRGGRWGHVGSLQEAPCWKTDD